MTGAGEEVEQHLSPNPESAAAAVQALQSELQLADGNLDALDRKAALLPAFLAALAGLFIDSNSVRSGLGLIATLIALALGICAVTCSLRAMTARAHVPGADVDQVTSNLHLPVADFNAALAGSLALAINAGTRIAVFKARWLNRGMILAVVTILFLSLSRFTGAPNGQQQALQPDANSSAGYSPVQGR